MYFRITVLISIMFSLALGAGDGNFILNDDTSEMRTVSADINRTVLSLKLSELEYQSEMIEGQQRYKVSLPDKFEMSRGAYLAEDDILLPTVTRMIAVPFDSNPTIQVVESHYTEIPGIALSPATEEELDSYSRENSESASLFQSQPVVGEVAGEMRDLRLYSIVFSPVQYDAENSTLRVYDDLEIEINHSGSRLTRIDNQVSEAFMPIYRSILDNIAVLDPVEVTRGAYWIIYPDVFFDHIQPIAEWKRDKGFSVEYIPKSDIGSNPSYVTIKNYISARYDSCQVKPDYITIIGDVSMPSGYGIPTRTYSNPYGFGDIESDNYYTFLSGNDYFPDLFIGRIAIDYASEMDSYSYKFFTYEREPYMYDTSWYLRGTMVAGGDNGYFVSPMMTKLWCRDRMLAYGYTDVDTIFEYYWGQVQPSVINNSINRGVAYVNYRGWGYPSGWSSPDYTVSNLGGLSNGPRFPVMTSVVCGTGDYNDYTDVCFGEAWIRNSNKGGVGFIGNSNHDAHTAWTNSIDVGIYWGLFDAGVTSLAQAELMGKLILYNAFPSDTQPNGQVELYFNSYNDLGDPELNCWTGVPREMTVTHADTLDLGQNLVSVTVLNDNDTPLEGAYVCLLKAGEIFTGEFVPSSGNVHFEIEPATVGDMALTVTARGFIPCKDTITFVESAMTLGYATHLIDDDSNGESSGNDDGICEPSETIELNVALRNYGQSETAYGVSAEISSVSPYINIIRGNADFSDLAPGESDTTDIPYLISIEPDAMNRSSVEILMTITDSNDHTWESILQVPVEAAELSFNGLGIVDGDNGMIDPGETFEMILTVENTGDHPITGASAVLRTSDDQVTILDSTAVFGDCEPGESFDNNGDSFICTVDQAIYVGHQINFFVEFEGDGPQIASVSFNEQVGEVSSTDPIGPDAYGYYCFDNTDTGYADHPEYDWIPIDTQNWDYQSIGDDNVRIIALPFQIRYYGHIYDQLTLCDNGFVALGASWWYAWLNTNIPAPQNAPAMVAPFWDDFVQYNLRVYYHYDEENSRFIIGWNNAWDDDVSRNQTFEIIFLDTDAWPTVTGDNEIIFQYYNVQYAYSASIGICSPDRQQGIGYLFNNNYADGAASVVNGRAIKFTTGSDYQTDTDDPSTVPGEFSLSQNYPNPFNASTLIEFSLPETGSVTLDVFNILGQKVASLADGKFDAGIHQITWKADYLPSGIYYYRLSTPDREDTKKMTLLK